MDSLQYINDIITLVILPWLILIERRLSRLEGKLQVALKELNDRNNRRGDCRLVG